MMNTTCARGEGTGNPTPLTGAQAEFAAELPRTLAELAGSFRRVGGAVDPGSVRIQAVAALRRQGQRARGFRLHALADELKVLGDRAENTEELDALAQAIEEAPRLVWWTAEDLPASGGDRPATPVPTSGLRDRSSPIALPVRGDFRIRTVGSQEVEAWVEARTDLQPVTSDRRADVLVVDPRALEPDAVATVLRDALEPIVVVLGDRALAAAHGAVGIEEVSQLDAVVELTRNRREVALLPQGSPARSARELGLELAQELQAALVDALEPSSAGLAVPLGRDPMVAAALWSAIARIRELVVRRSEGRVRFADAGPDGATVLAAELSEEVRNLERRRSADRAGDVSLEGLRALVVDDDEVVTWFIAEQLRAAGMVVTELYDGGTARGVAERERPDIIVSDVVMPGMDGLTLARALRRDVTLGDVPLVLLSWKEDLLRRVRELGGEADGYVRKESDGEHLLAAVREAMRPRLRLAERLATEETVSGRLDGMTSFTLARLVAEKKGTSRLVVRDGRHAFELEVSGGLLVSCTRSGSDGSLLRGRRALASYLGVRSARFEASPLGRVSQVDTAKPLAAAVESLVERARASVELVAERWLSLASLELDLELVESGAPALPASLKRGLDGLRDGVAPHRLIASGAVEADSLLALLLDLARRGAIVTARDNLGTDRLRESLDRVRARGLVAAPKARFSLPVVVPVPLDFLDELPSVSECGVPTGSDVPSSRATLDVTTDGSFATEASGCDAGLRETPATDAQCVSIDASPEMAVATAVAIPYTSAPDRSPEDAAVEGEPASEATADEFASASDAPPPDVSAANSAPTADGLPDLACNEPIEPADALPAGAASSDATPDGAVPGEGAPTGAARDDRAAVRMASPIATNARTISWLGFLLALGLVALGGTVASWVAVRHLPQGRVPTVFR